MPSLLRILCFLLACRLNKYLPSDAFIEFARDESALIRITVKIEQQCDNLLITTMLLSESFFRPACEICRQFDKNEADKMGEK